MKVITVSDLRANLVRQDGGNPSQVRFVAGLRLWF